MGTDIRLNHHQLGLNRLFLSGLGFLHWRSESRLVESHLHTMGLKTLVYILTESMFYLFGESIKSFTERIQFHSFLSLILKLV